MKVSVFAEISSVLGINYRDYCTFVVVKKDGEYYFFGNNILLCLGHDATVKDWDALVPNNERYTLGPTISNVYIKEDTIRRLAAAEGPFLDWFNGFINNCKGPNPDSRYCP